MESTTPDIRAVYSYLLVKHPAQGAFCFSARKRKGSHMTDQQNKTLETPEVSATTEQADAQHEVDNTDWKAEARKWEQRAKENKGKADEFEEYRTKTERELERAKARAEKAEAQACGLAHANEVRQWVSEVSKEAEIPAEVLTELKFETREDLQALAEKLKPYFEHSIAPTIGSDKGVSNIVSEDGEMQILARQLFK